MLVDALVAETSTEDEGVEARVDESDRGDVASVVSDVESWNVLDDEADGITGGKAVEYKVDEGPELENGAVEASTAVVRES